MFRQVEPDHRGGLFKSQAMGYEEIHDAEPVTLRDCGVSYEFKHDHGLFITSSHEPHIPVSGPCCFHHLGNMLKDKRYRSLNMLAHNHPSGDPTPSGADIRMTQDIVAIAQPFGIAVHDHLIVGRHGQTSFKGLKLI